MLRLAQLGGSSKANGTVPYAPSGEALEDHVRKEVAYREEVAKQLQLVRGNCNVQIAFN